MVGLDHLLAEANLSDVYAQPSKRLIIRDIDPRVVLSARVSAENGYYLQASDLCETLMQDARVSACLSQRVDGVLALKKQFYHKNQKVIEALEEDFDDIVSASVLSLMIKRAMMSGIGLCQAEWKDAPSGRLVPALDSWSASGLNVQQGKLMLEVVPKGMTSWVERIEILPGEPGKWQWVIGYPYSNVQPMRFALWQSLVDILALKRWSEKDWSGFGEFHGRGLKVLDQPQGPSDLGQMDGGAARLDGRQMLDLASKVDSATSGATIGLPPGVRLALLEAMSNSWQTFPQSLQYVNGEIAIAVVGQNLTTEVKGASLAASEVHERVSGDKIAWTALCAVSILTPILRQWERVNFGTSELTWCFDTTPPADLTVTANAIKTGAEALQTLVSIRTSVPVDLAKICERLEFELDGKVGMPAKAPQMEPEALSAHDPISASAIEGQLAIDKMSANSAQQAVLPLVDAVTKALTEATSFDELKGKLMEQYAHLDSKDLAVVLHRAMRLATSAGAFYARGD